MKYAAIGPIASYLPERVEDNRQLKAEFPQWDMEQIYAKTGIWSRHVAAEDECASDLGVAAANRLFEEHEIQRESIDFLLFCTQTPDYPLPTTACMVQDRLGLRTSIGALDFNLGCSGFVYGLSLADGLIRAGSARRVLLITADTYSKYIDPTDRSLRTIFGDGAAATLIDSADEPSLGSFVFGTDGRGADALMVNSGGARPAESAHKPRKRQRWPSRLYMDGPELVQFSLNVGPPMVEQILDSMHVEREDIDYFLMHQATFFMLEHLRARLNLDQDAVPVDLKDHGNTVSSTIPIMMRNLRRSSQLAPGKLSMMISFGVGLSWAGCLWKETWQAEQAMPRPVVRPVPSTARRAA